jgi:hypothetical protein
MLRHCSGGVGGWGLCADGLCAWWHTAGICHYGVWRMRGPRAPWGSASLRSRSPCGIRGPRMRQTPHGKSVECAFAGPVALRGRGGRGARVAARTGTPALAATPWTTTPAHDVWRARMPGFPGPPGSRVLTHRICGMRYAVCGTRYAVRGTRNRVSAYPHIKTQAPKHREPEHPHALTSRAGVVAQSVGDRAGEPVLSPTRPSRPTQSRDADRPASARFTDFPCGVWRMRGPRIPQGERDRREALPQGARGPRMRHTP